MGKISGSETVTVNGSVDEVMAFLTDIANQHTWWPGMFKSEPLETDADGRVTKARIGNDVKIAKDEFDVDYSYDSDTSYSWSLGSKSSMQRSQDGSWTVKDKGGKTEATLALEVDPSLPLPGFVLKKTLNDSIKNAAKALQKSFES
jgi:Polyketide cyclase / dehydrase and lipid transport